jgi:hypothetical protein
VSGDARQRLVVTAPEGSRLAQLQASYDALKAAVTEAKERYETLTEAIKAELATAHPGVPGITLAGGPGMPVLQLTWVESWRFDSKRFKEDDPLTYVRYAKKSEHWELRAQ